MFRADIDTEKKSPSGGSAAPTEKTRSRNVEAFDGRLRTNDLSLVTLAVLVGGRGDRMGLPKSWMQFGRKPVLAWLLERMRWAGPTMLVSAPAVAHPPGSELFNCEVVDPVDGLGPLRGVLTALEHLSTPMK